MPNACLDMDSALLYRLLNRFIAASLGDNVGCNSKIASTETII